MAARSEHTFEFQADEIARAAGDEAKFHEERLRHWQERAEKALTVVEQTIGAEVIHQPQTDGTTMARVVVDYGNPEAWEEYQLAKGKVQTHRSAAERYRTDERVYGTQGSRPYRLDTDDVHHFRLGGQPRED